MKRQMRDKVGTLINRVDALNDRVETIIDHFEDIRHEMANMSDRQIASNAKLDAIMDLLMQLVNRRKQSI